jgi:hypothetical protein
VIELGRRGFITGLAALSVVAAPAVIRVAPLMKISKRFTPMYVPINWLFGTVDDGFPVPRTAPHHELKRHAWPRPLGPMWVDINDHDPDYVRHWVKRIEEEENERLWA